MTCDGVRALLACGLSREHPRVVAARKWIERNFTVMHNPGTFASDREPIRDATYYYYCWSLAHALVRLNVRDVETPSGSVRWAEVLAEELVKRQETDGSWRNRLSDGREDEPLVATPFAAAALEICRLQLARVGHQRPPEVAREKFP
jgi:squalene-hopene/tetraprenyl-beta-curcumene cyclase